MRNSKLKFRIRKSRVRAKISRVSDRARLSVFKSGKHIYAQVIDDVEDEEKSSNVLYAALVVVLLIVYA